MPYKSGMGLFEQAKEEHENYQRIGMPLWRKVKRVGVVYPKEDKAL